MPLFGKKKTKNGPTITSLSQLSTLPGVLPPGVGAPGGGEHPTQTIVKIVGDSKHIITTHIVNGVPHKTTQIAKLTEDELKALGFGHGGVPMKKAHDVLAPTKKHPLSPRPVAKPKAMETAVAKEDIKPMEADDDEEPESAPKDAPPPKEEGKGEDKEDVEEEDLKLEEKPFSPTPAGEEGAEMEGSNSSLTTPQDGNALAASIGVTRESIKQYINDIDVTRELVKQYIADIWNRGDIDLIPKVCHPSLRFNGHQGMDRVGHEGFAQMVTTVRAALTDYHCEIHSMVVESNKAFCRLRFTGKHTGNLLGYPPTGKTVSWSGAAEFTCKNGRILRVWELGDVKTLELQLQSNT